MALAYAAHGWPALALHSIVDGRCDCRKTGCKPAKHPRTMHGLTDATTDEEQIRRWWGMWPRANVGIATGIISGLVVVDVDPKNGGFETVDELEAQGKIFPHSPVVRTQSGGWHLYYQHPGDRKVSSGSNVIGKGIDIRADGGYVVAPPSIGIDGPYTWLVACELGQLS